MSPSVFFIVQPIRNHGLDNYGDVLLFGVVSLMVGSTTGVRMSSGHSAPSKSSESISALLRNEVKIRNIYLRRRGPQVLHLQGSRVMRQETKAPEYYTTEYTVPAYYTEAPAYFNDKAVEYYTEPHKYYSAPNYTTTAEAAKYYVAQTYNTAAAPSYYVEPNDYTEAPVYYTTYAIPRYYDEVPNYYTEEATYYTTRYTAPVYYTEEPKYYSAPSYYKTEAPVYYTKPPSIRTKC